MKENGDVKMTGFTQPVDVRCAHVCGVTSRFDMINLVNNLVTISDYSVLMICVGRYFTLHLLALITLCTDDSLHGLIV